MPVTSTEHGMFGSSDVEANRSDSEEEEVREMGYKKPKLASRKRRRGSNSSEPEDRKDKGEVTVIQSKKRRRHSPEPGISDEELRLPRERLTVNRRKAILESDDDSEPKEEEEEAKVTPPRTRRRKISQRQLSPESEEEGDKDEEETAPPRSRRRDRSRRQQNKDVQEGPSTSRNMRRKLTERPATPSEEEDEEEVEEDPYSGAVSATEDEEEREDLQEDLAFLRSSPVADRGKLRSTHEKPKSERQKALEALKRRRAGTNEPSSSATPGRSRRIVMEDSDSDLEVIKEEVESELEVISDPEDEGIDDDDEDDEDEPDRDANALDMFQEDKYALSLPCQPIYTFILIPPSQRRPSLHR